MRRALAGVLVAAAGGAVTLGVDALTFAVSALTLVFVRRPLQAAGPPDATSLGQQVREGLAFIAGDRLLAMILGYWALITFFTSPIVIAATYFVRDDLGRSSETLGVIFTTYAVGAIAGAVVANRLRQAPGLVMVTGTILGSVAVLVLSATSWLPLILGVALVAGMGESLAGILYATLRAGLTPDELLGRVATTAQVVTFGLRPLAVFAAGVLLEATSGATTLATIGISCLVVSLLLLSRNTFMSAPALAPEVTR
jgi:Na+/melibiose symporter-like transporter